MHSEFLTKFSIIGWNLRNFDRKLLDIRISKCGRWWLVGLILKWCIFSEGVLVQNWLKFVDMPKILLTSTLRRNLTCYVKLRKLRSIPLCQSFQILCFPSRLVHVRSDFLPTEIDFGSLRVVGVHFWPWKSILGIWESILRSGSRFWVSKNQLLWAFWGRFLDIWESSFGPLESISGLWKFVDSRILGL